MNTKPLNFQKIIQYFLFVLLLMPIVYLPWMWRPAQTSKSLFFVVCVGLIFLAVLALCKWTKIAQRLKNPIVLLLGLYIAFVSVVSIFGVDPINSFFGNDVRIGGTFLLMHTFVFSTLLFVFFDQSSWKRAEQIFVLSGVFISMYGFLEIAGIVPSLGENLPRATSIMGNPIYLAAYLIFPFTIALMGVRVSEKNVRNFNIIAAIILFLGLFSTGTRGVFVALIAGAVVAGLLFLKQFKNWKKVYLIFSLSLVAACSVFFIAQATVPNSSFYYRFFHFGDQSVMSRVEFWKMALKGVPEHLLIGVGYENYYHLAEKNYTAILYEAEGSYSDKPHNAYIEILACSGVIGLALYLSLLFFVARAIHEAKKQKVITSFQESVLVFGFVAYLVQNFFAFDTIGTLFTFSFFLAYVAHISVKNEVLLCVEYRGKKLSLLLLVLFLGLFGWYFMKFVQPTYFFFSTLAQANGESDLQKRFAFLKSIPEDGFVYDRNTLGKLYHNGSKLLYANVGNTQLVKDYVQAALDQYEFVVKAHPNRGEYWYQKSDMGLLAAFVNKQPIDQETKFAVEKAIELTPTRTEPYLVKATELEMEGKIQEAIDLLEETRLHIPNSDKLFWTLSVLYAKSGNDEKSASLGYQAIERGLNVTGLQSITDLVLYYAEKKDLSKVIVLYTHAIRLFPDVVDLNASLAAAYAENGQIKEAIETARKFEQLKPEAKASVDAFIQSLPTSK